MRTYIERRIVPIHLASNNRQSDLQASSAQLHISVTNCTNTIMGHGDGHRRRNYDERSRSRSRSRPRTTRPSTNSKSKTVEKPSHYKTSEAPESSRRRRDTEDTYRDSKLSRRARSPRANDPFYKEMKENDLGTDAAGNKYVPGELVVENLEMLPGPPPERRSRSMIGRRRNEIPVAVDCLEVKVKKRPPDGSGSTRRIMPASKESITTLDQRPVPGRDSLPSRAYSPEIPSRRIRPGSRGQRSRSRGAYLPDDTRYSGRDYPQRSSKGHRERRSPSPPVPSLQYSSRQSGHKIPETGLESYHPPAPPELYREARSMEVPSYLPVSATTDPSSPRYRADLSRPLPHIDPQPSSPTYARTSAVYGSQGGSGYAHPPDYTGTCDIDGSKCFTSPLTTRL